MTACWSFCSWSCRARSRPSRSTASPPTGCAARRPGIAAIPDREPGDAIHRDRALPSRSAACSAPCVFRAREHVEMPPPGDTRAGAAHGRAARSDLGCALCADRRRRRHRRRPAQPSAVSDHPPISHAWSSARWSFCSWCSPYGPDPRSRHPGRADAAGAGCWRRSSPASCAR